MTSLLIVESPAKAKTINKYLGKDYKVLASFGHIRQLPKKDGSVDVNNNFEIKYEIDKKSSKHVKDIVDAMKTCNKLILATDPDREGEAIAWHVLEVLKLKRAIKKDTEVQRVVFNAITKNTVEEAIKNPRQIDMDLVDAQQARTGLDYLVGFTLSPVLWRKLPGSKSAGRVQSVALRLICERHAEILAFKPEEYWDINADLLNANKKHIIAKLVEANGKKIDKLSIKNYEEALKLKKELEVEKYTVDSVDKKEIKKNPYAPFTTSTMQQEASKKLGFTAKKTMSVAQKLYEGIDIGSGSHGLITYMRTDGLYTAPEAIESARNTISKNYGKNYLPAKPIIYENKIKNAQEAHEAIRPTDPSITPESIKQYLSGDEFKLYELIWKRLIASQMASAILDQTSINISTSKHKLRATGSVIKFDGFYILYKETNEDATDDKGDIILPSVDVGESLNLLKIIDKQHFTEPPAKYSEASLVKKMEELGIGRPSTYATIISVLQERGYVKIEKKRFVPEDRGIVVNAFLKLFFTKYVEYDYTAKLENDLDEISNGKRKWKEFLNEFWSPFHEKTESVLGIKNSDVLSSLTEYLKDFIFGYDSDGKLKNKCPDCSDGALSIKSSKFGLFIACSNYPNCKHTEKLISNFEDESEGDSDDKNNKEKRSIEVFEPKVLGQINNLNVYVKKGPYGFYVQLGEDATKPKPKRVGLGKNINIDEIDFKKAESLLSLPRIIGKHPEDGSDITANIGPYGPYLQWNKKFFSCKNDDILTITLNKAVVVINEEIQKKKDSLKSK